MLCIAQFCWGEILYVKIVPPPSTKEIKQHLKIINKQEPPSFSEIKYQLQKHTTTPYL